MTIHLSALKQLKAETAEKKVILVAVSKTKSTDQVMEVYQNGQKVFGENYVQELVEKQAQLPADIQWHFIGHLQTNKVKFIAPFISVIQTVDSINLLKEINKQGIKCGRVISCLLQIFIAEEETKFGLSQMEAKEILESDLVAEFKNIAIIGFMGMATNTHNHEQVKKEFEELAAFYREMKKKQTQFSLLSMGMTSDYKLAMNAGSNMIRIGSAIFGDR